jgi:hypothetical protein
MFVDVFRCVLEGWCIPLILAIGSFPLHIDDVLLELGPPSKWHYMHVLGEAPSKTCSTTRVKSWALTSDYAPLNGRLQTI